MGIGRTTPIKKFKDLKEVSEYIRVNNKIESVSLDDWRLMECDCDD